MQNARFSFIRNNIANLFGRTRQSKQETAPSSAIASLPRPQATAANVSDSGRIKFGAGLRHANR
jgi:hypothetical protein